jgi:hypothetical protein
MRPASSAGFVRMLLAFVAAACFAGGAGGSSRAAGGGAAAAAAEGALLEFDREDGRHRRWLTDRVAFLEASSGSSSSMSLSSASLQLLRRRAAANQQSLQPTAHPVPNSGAATVQAVGVQTSLLDSRVAPMGSQRPWYDIRGMEQLPNCLAAAERGSRLVNMSAALVTHACAPDELLQPGDYLLIADKRDVTFGLDGAAARAAAARRDRDAHRLVRVLSANKATGHALQLLLDQPWPEADASGLTVFRVLLSADAIIARVRREGDVLRRVRTSQLQGELADEGEEKAKARDRDEQEEKAKAAARAKAAEEEEKAKLGRGGNGNGTGDGSGSGMGGGDGSGKEQRNVTCEGGVWLPGEVAVVAGSPVVTTTVDLRGEVPVGGRVWIANRTFVVTEPRDAITLTLSAPWPQEEGSASGMHACRLLVRYSC